MNYDQASTNHGRNQDSQGHARGGPPSLPRSPRAFLFAQDEESDLEVVAQAGSLAEARAALLDGHLDVAVLDLGLPNGDGSELIGEMRRANPGVLVVVLSAAMGPGHVEEVVRAGAESVLDKVESIPTIAEEVRRLTGR
jgi:DNA-binding NarL/FixJ family response regulator